jgi:uncharacterized membrane protein
MRDQLFCAALLLLITCIVEAGNRHEPPQYRIEQLEGIGGFATDINRHGAITGEGFPKPSGPTIAYLWTRKRSILLTAEPPTRLLAGNGVNDKGQVAGTLVAFDPQRTRGFVWTRGRFVEIGDLPGGNSVSSAADINNAGQVAGVSDSAKGTECILWERGNLMSIGDLGGFNCTASAINASGDIVGSGTTQQGIFFRPFLWHEGTMTELPLPPGVQQGFATDINRWGVAVGFSDEGPIVWSNGQMTLLPGLEGLPPIAGVTAIATGINDRGDIVGSVLTSIGLIPILWHDGVAINLNDLVPASDPLKSCARLSVADAINNRGEIAVHGPDECDNGRPSIYRLVPVKGKGRK